MAPTKRRQYRIGVCFSEEELEEISERFNCPAFIELVREKDFKMRRGKKEVNARLRQLILDKDIQLVVPAVNQQAVAELLQWGKNLNQIAKRINEGRVDANVEALDKILRDITEARRKWAGELTGARLRRIA